MALRAAEHRSDEQEFVDEEAFRRPRAAAPCFGDAELALLAQAAARGASNRAVAAGVASRRAALQRQGSDDESDDAPKLRRPKKKRRRRAHSAPPPQVREFGADLPSASASDSESDSESPRTRPRKTPAGRWNAGRFRKHVKARLDAAKASYGASIKGNELQQTSRDERDLTRLAWVLQQLHGARTCVAILMREGQVLVYANKADKRLEADLQDVSALLDGTEQDVDAIIQRLLKTKPRWGETDEQLAERVATTERRLRKALRLLKTLHERNPDEPIGKVHGHKHEGKHAEMHAADAAARGLEAGEGGFVAITKLCCGKCHLALDALRKTKDIRIDVQGAHFKTYATKAGWRMPDFLRDPEALEAFLGPEAYALYKANPEAAREIIETERLGGGYARTEAVSSGEEVDSDEELQGDESVASSSDEERLSSASTAPRPSPSRHEDEDEDEDEDRMQVDAPPPQTSSSNDWHSRLRSRKPESKHRESGSDSD